MTMNSSKHIKIWSIGASLAFVAAAWFYLVNFEQQEYLSRADQKIESGVALFKAKKYPEALEVFEKERDNIDIVMLDMIMPKLGGVATFRKLRELDPRLPVVLVSGYAQDKAVRELVKEGAGGFLQKPYRLARLYEAVSSVLSAETPAPVSYEAPESLALTS